MNETLPPPLKARQSGAKRSRPDLGSFHHLSSCDLGGKACRGTACFVARHLNPQRWANPLILWASLVEVSLILLIPYTPWGNLAFRTTPLPLPVRLFVAPFAPAMLALEELRKWIVRGVQKSRELHLGTINHANV